MKSKFINKTDKILYSKDLYALAGTILLWAALLFTSNISGNFPLNDDWSYAYSVKTLLEQGKIELTGWVSMPIVTQIFWGYLFTALFGFSFDILRMSTVILGAAGIVFSYLIISEATKSVYLRFIAALMIAINPLYFLLSSTFMTDVPFFTFSIIAIFFFTKYLKSKSKINLILGIIFIIAASFIRQIGGLTLLAFAVVYSFDKEKAVIYKLLLLLIVLSLFIALANFPSFIQSAIEDPLIDNTRMVKFFDAFSLKNLFGLIPIIKNGFAAMLYICLFLSPLFLLYFREIKLIIREKNYKTFIFTFISAALFILSLLVYFDKLLPLRPNVLFYYGFGPATLRDVDILELQHLTVIPKSIWILLTFIGLINSMFISFFFFIHNWKKKQKKLIDFEPVKVFMFLTACFYLIFIGLADFYDRYIIFLLPIITFLVLNSDHNFSIGYIKKGIIYLILAVTAFFTVYETHNYFSWNRCRWEAIEYLTEELKIPKDKIDGGFEFNAWYGYDPGYVRDENKSWWWVKDDEYLIAFGSTDNYNVLKKFSYSSLTKTKFLYVLRKVK
jgi:hypothetical protein